MNLKNKRVLITGSSSGIGQATAIEFAKKGAIVFINYKENEKGAMETLNEVKKYSDGKIFKADLTNISEIKKMVIDIVKEYKNIDALVNNASDYVYGDIDNIKA
jgi:NAD(P)-dependent dehydrogenase (short-subunit alcohol dehydrogenase family)